MTKKYTYLLGVLLIVVAIAINNFVFKLDAFDIENKNALAIINAELLISDLKSNKEKYNALFTDQVVGIKGIISEINDKNNRHTILLQGDEKSVSLVICDMQKDQKQKTNTLKIGDTVVLKGIYKGFLKDAVFLNCILSTDKLTND